MPAEPEAREPTEEERVFTNVERHFLDLGFNHLQAEVLAENHADWHDAAKLLERGCSHETAFDILL